MNRSAPLHGLFARLAGQGLTRGPVVGPFDGHTIEVWLRDGEPAVALLVDGDPDDLTGLHRIAWSLGCPSALVDQQGRVRLLGTAVPPSERSPQLLTGPGRIGAVPAPVPGVTLELTRLAGIWRERLLRQCLAGHRDWTESALNLAVEAPIAGLLLGTAVGAAAADRMHAELRAAGVVLGAVPRGLIALAWDLHLARGVRLTGADASVVRRPPADRSGLDRTVLRRFAAWAGSDAVGTDRVLVPACGAGRLLLACGDWAAAHNIQVYALDSDPRAVLFTSAVLESEFGDRLACTVRAAHPLIEADLDDDPLARLIPEDARARLRPADWTTLFSGVDRFDRVLIADPAVPLTRRSAVQRHVESRYSIAAAGIAPALLLVEAGVRHLTTNGRVLALYRVAAYRVPSASVFRRWLAQRADVLITAPGYCMVRAAAEPIATPILVTRFDRKTPVLRPYPRSALDPGSWTVTDPARAMLITRLETGSAPLGDVLLGGVRMPTVFPLDKALLINARTRRRILHADPQAAGVIRPLIAPEDVVRFGSAHAVSRFVVDGPLPPRALRLARELGLVPPETDPFPPPAGPRLLFEEGARTPAFLCDSSGRAVPMAGVGTIAPADSFLAGLLHSEPMAALMAERCQDVLSARCLARLPVRLPDPYDEREQRIGNDIAALARERIALPRGKGPWPDRSLKIEAAIDRAVERLYGISSP